MFQEFVILDVRVKLFAGVSVHSKEAAGRFDEGMNSECVLLHFLKTNLAIWIKCNNKWVFH